jgi:hypothetical protein
MACPCPQVLNFQSSISVFPTLKVRSCLCTLSPDFADTKLDVNNQCEPGAIDNAIKLGVDVGAGLAITAQVFYEKVRGARISIPFLDFNPKSLYFNWKLLARRIKKIDLM